MTFPSSIRTSAAHVSDAVTTVPFVMSLRAPAMGPPPWGRDRRTRGGERSTGAQSLSDVTLAVARVALLAEDAVGRVGHRAVVDAPFAGALRAADGVACDGSPHVARVAVRAENASGRVRHRRPVEL